MTLDQLHREYGFYLLTCLRMYGVPEGECEDVRQNLYVRLIESQYDLTTIRAPKGFCATLARRAAIDLHRGWNPTMEPADIVTNDGDTMDHPELTRQAMTIWGAITTDSQMSRIERALEEATRFTVAPGITAFDLIIYLIQDMTHKEIAAKFSVTRRETVSGWLKKWYNHAKTLK
jgi:DNA-directed RNA polymerase specialized sigma24 family protein